ncbi:MAG: ATP phosphoribosyltransferase regulatory subunit, partial [Gammaproteobacteria bacterium]
MSSDGKSEVSSTNFSSSPWLLPEGVEEVLPPYAAVLERARRSVLDLFAGWGYELVMPPFVEHLDSLLTGTGQDLELETFKLIDQMSGRLLGVRADMTPQVARMDAHSLGRASQPASPDTPSRLCYLGTVLRAIPDGMSASRTPVQLGAELYGHAGVESDCEVLCLLLETLCTLGVADVHVDLGHVGIFRSLARRAQLEPETESLVHDALQRKARPELEALLAARNVASGEAERIIALTELNGDASVLERARALLDPGGDELGGQLDAISGVAAEVERHRPATQVHYDLAELRGYRYHTGIVFAAFVPGHGEEIGRG